MAEAANVKSSFDWPNILTVAPDQPEAAVGTLPAREARPASRRRVAIFADGAELHDMIATYRAGTVQGFTTNPTLMRQAGVTDYIGFARAVLAEIRDLPISFEVFADELAEIERQARLIASWGDQVFVKVPVMTTRGESTRSAVANLSRSGVKLNVTALLTSEQVEDVCRVLDPGVPSIVSVFAGRIADTGRDPIPIIREALEIARPLPLVRVLWASPREVLNVYQAEACGCHIITATKAILEKLPLGGKDLLAVSRDTVQMFYGDAQRAGYVL